MNNLQYKQCRRESSMPALLLFCFWFLLMHLDLASANEVVRVVILSVNISVQLAGHDKRGQFSNLIIKFTSCLGQLAPFPLYSTNECPILNFLKRLLYLHLQTVCMIIFQCPHNCARPQAHGHECRWVSVCPAVPGVPALREPCVSRAGAVTPAITKHPAEVWALIIDAAGQSPCRQYLP